MGGEVGRAVEVIAVEIPGEEVAERCGGGEGVAGAGEGERGDLAIGCGDGERKPDVRGGGELDRGGGGRGMDGAVGGEGVEGGGRNGVGQGRA